MAAVKYKEKRAIRRDLREFKIWENGSTSQNSACEGAFTQQNDLEGSHEVLPHTRENGYST
jgi:hypothetical protein